MKIDKLLDTIYGLILFCDFQTSCDIHAMISEDWNEDQLHKRLYKTTGDLIGRVENPDLVSIVGEFRKNEWFLK